MVSIRDVAERAGVAISTVSKVLHHYPNISEATQEKVHAAIRELNYVPNSIAAALSSKKSGRIALLMDPKRQTAAIDQVFMQYLIGALDCVREQDMEAVTIFFSMLDNMDVDDIIRYLMSLNISGFIVFNMSREDKKIRDLIDREEFPAVLVDAPIEGEKITCVGIDHEQAQYDVARKTIIDNIQYLPEDHGPQSVLYIAGNGNGYVTADRTKGMRRLAAELELSLTVRYGDYSEKKARDITMAAGRDRDVIVCASDLMAIGAMNALREMDIFHPVCGYDEITLMGYVGKQMNTVKQDFYEIARTAVIEVKRLMEGETGRKVVVPHTLVRLEYLDIIR